MGSESNKWKSKLLSSSIPLEFEAAKILSNKGFISSYDFSYVRKDGQEIKEFSTDLYSRLYYPENDKNINATLNILIECKYREEGKKWLFVPDINNPDFSNFVTGNTIRSLREFSTAELIEENIGDFESHFDFSLKGLEVNMKTGDVYDADIKHGVNQLKYALPYLFKRAIEYNLNLPHMDDIELNFIVPILLTNSELFLLNHDFSISQLKESDNIENISKKVPCLILYSDIGPSFVEHHSSIFNNFYSSKSNNKNLLTLEKIQEKIRYGLFKKRHYSPINSCVEYQLSEYRKLIENYSQFFVCSFSNFPHLINDIILTVSKSFKSQHGQSGMVL